MCEFIYIYVYKEKEKKSMMREREREIKYKEIKGLLNIHPKQMLLIKEG